MPQARTLAEAIRIANAAGMDAANRSMARRGRAAWNEADYQAAHDAFEKVLGGLGFGAFANGESA